MMAPAAAAFALALLAAAPASAQSTSLSSDPSTARWKIPAEAEPGFGPGVSLPVIRYTAPDGSLKMKRGIVAGMQVSPNTTVGVGLYETLPTKRALNPSDDPLERKQRRARKAAVGVSLSF